MSGAEVVGAVFANVSIALQLADAALKLHNFWKSVKDAPKSLRDLVQNLRTLQGVLQAIHTEEKMLPGPQEALPTYEPLLECQRYFDELRALAERLQVDISKGKMQRTWKSLKIVFEKNHLDEFRSNLESMKSTLILARQTLASMLAAHNASFIANSVATITTQLSAQQTQNIKTVRHLESMGNQLDEHINVVGTTLQNASNNTIPAPMLSALKSTIRSCAKETFKESFEKHYADMRKLREETQRKQRQYDPNDEDEWDDFEPSVPQRVSTAMSFLSSNENEETLVDIEDQVTSDIREKYEHVTVRKQYETLFGRLEIVIDAIFADADHEKGDSTSSMRSFQATLSFRPSSWLSRPALWRITTKRSASNSRHGLVINPTYSPIVSHKSPVFQACRQGKVLEVKAMITTGQASVHDIDEWGRGLMHMAVKSRNMNLLNYLINEGCVKGLVDYFGNSPLDMISFFETSHQEYSEPTRLININKTIDLVRLLVEKADCDPNFEHFENRCGNNLLQNLCKYRRVLDLRNLTPIIHYLLTQETFCMAPSPSAIIPQARTFSPLSDMLYHTEEEATTNMTSLASRHRIDATFVAEFGYSTMQDALMQDHDVAVIRSLILSGAWLHTKNSERQTPTRIAWWRSTLGQDCLPFALFKSSRPPEDAYEIYEFLLQNGNFAKTLEACGIDLWDFSMIEAKVLASYDRDEPLQYVTHACYHRRKCEQMEDRANSDFDAPLPYRRRSHPFSYD